MPKEMENQNTSFSPPLESSVSQIVRAGVSQGNITACSLNDLSAISGRGSYLPLIVSSVNTAFSGEYLAGIIVVLFVWPDCIWFGNHLLFLIMVWKVFSLVVLSVYETFGSTDVSCGLISHWIKPTSLTDKLNLNPFNLDHSALVWTQPSCNFETHLVRCSGTELWINWVSHWTHSSLFHPRLLVETLLNVATKNGFLKKGVNH